MNAFSIAAIFLFTGGVILDMLGGDFRLVSVALVAGGVCFMTGLIVGA